MLDLYAPTPRHCDGQAGSRPGATPCDPDCPSRYRAAAGGRVDGRPVRTTPGDLHPFAVGWQSDPPACCETCATRRDPGACPGTDRCATVAMVAEALEGRR